MVRLSELVATVPEAWIVSGDANVEVVDVQLDSRAVGDGTLFCCVPGTLVDGHLFIADAIGAGAVGVVTEREHGVDLDGVVEVRIPRGSMRRICAALSAAVEGNPAGRLILVGITGTNGKTTVAHIVREILAAAQFDASVIGTLTGARTTPPAPELHRLFAEKVRHAEQVGQRGAVAMEVSSHALDQGRVSGIHFEVGVFTNLSPEHLDYHHTMEEYFEAKASLFTPEVSRHVVIWTESPEGELLAARRSDAHRVSFELASDVCATTLGSTFVWRDHQVVLPLLGSVNIINTLISLETAFVLGVDPRVAVDAVASIAPVPGRMDLVGKTPEGASIIVDYAHTPEALERLIAEARSMASGSGRVIVVFGCGGDRDKSKRPVMGAIASDRADVVVVTTDNPRHEKAADIAAEIMSGVVGSAEVLDVPGRRQAIEEAVGMAREGDVIVIAGKGHETTQIIGDEATLFDDRLVALEVMGQVS